jgi:hypothetical protein
VIDYQSSSPISKYLATHYSDQRFNAIIDAYGVQELYSYAGKYLSPGKPFVTVGIAHKKYRYSSMLHAVFMMVMNSLTSLLPGDGQRKYLQVNAAVNLEAMEKLRSLVEHGKLRVLIDSCWGMNDVLQVRSRRVYTFAPSRLTN